MNRFWTAASLALAFGMSWAAGPGASSAAAQGASSDASSAAARGTRSGASSAAGQGASSTLDQGVPVRSAHSDSPSRESSNAALPALLDATMTLIGEAADLPAAVTKNLELPRDDSGAYLASPRAVERAAKGLSTANLAREDGRAFGQATAEAAREESRGAADEAREAGRAFAEAAAAAAQQNREDLGHRPRPTLAGLPGERDVPVVPVHAALPAAFVRP